jgi:hypothetical protein
MRPSLSNQILNRSWQFALKWPAGVIFIVAGSRMLSLSGGQNPIRNLPSSSRARAYAPFAMIPEDMNLPLRGS